MRSLKNLAGCLFAILAVSMLSACGGGEEGDPFEGEAEAEGEGEGGEGSYLSATFECWGETYELFFSNDPDECEPCSEECSENDPNVCRFPGDHNCLAFFGLSAKSTTPYLFGTDSTNYRCRDKKGVLQYDSQGAVVEASQGTRYTRPGSYPACIGDAGFVVNGHEEGALFQCDGSSPLPPQEDAITVEEINGGNALRITFHVEQMEPSGDSLPSPQDCTLTGEAVYVFTD